MLLLCSCASNRSDVHESSQARDLAYLYKTLPKRHINLYSQHSKGEFQKAYDQALQKAGNLSPAGFYFTLRSLVALSGDSHTSVGITQDIVSCLKAVPVQFSYVDGTWRVSVIERTYGELLAAELVSLNRIPIDEIETLARSVYSYDNEVWFRHALSQQLNLTNLYSYLGIADFDDKPVVVTVLPHQETEKVSITLNPVSSDQYNMQSFVTWYQKMPQTYASNAAYRAMTFEKSDALFIQYNACISIESYPIETFTEEVLTLLENGKFSKVLVDLRYNGGGDSRLFEPMIDGLGKLQKERYFTIDVLVGEGTFSSALMNAIHFKRRTDCRLVGQPSGGSVNHYGEVQFFKLPESGIPITYSTKHFVMDRSYGAGPLIPDVVIMQRVDDILKGRDTVVEDLLTLHLVGVENQDTV